MEKHLKNFKKNFLKLSLIGIIFFLSCGREEAQRGDSGEWYTKLGFKEVGKQMRKDTQLLTRRLGELDWEEAIGLCNTISGSFEKLDIVNPIIPKDFAELKQDFDNKLSKLLIACKDEDYEVAKLKLEIFKKSCHHCHVIFRKDLDASNTATDFDVAVDKLYKDLP
jgi:hypothetical protein